MAILAYSAALFFLLVFVTSCRTDRAIQVEEQPLLPAAIEPKPRAELSGKVDLTQLPSTDARLRFQFENGLETPVFLAYSRESYDDEHSLFIPYSIECRTERKKGFRSYGPEWHLLPRLAPLSSGDNIVFSIEKPRISAECVVSIGYYADERAATLVTEKPFTRSKSEEEFIDKSQRAVTLKLRLE